MCIKRYCKNDGEELKVRVLGKTCEIDKDAYTEEEIRISKEQGYKNLARLYPSKENIIFVCPKCTYCERS
jgi:hypothetical protein